MIVQELHLELERQTGELVVQPPELVPSVTITLTQFDQKHYRELIQARGETIQRVIGKLKPLLELTTAVDVGCGVGFFAEMLRKSGLSVGGFDGRQENVAEARRRFPDIPFECADIEDPAITRIGKFDLVLCFGLLYHLENPMLAIRHLRAITAKGLLLESMCVPGNRAEMLVREESRAADQSLTEIAVCPSESGLVKMLYRAGFENVYRVAELPEHDDFRETPEHARRRTVLFASVVPVRLAGFVAVAEPRAVSDPWAKVGAVAQTVKLRHRVQNFMARPRRSKYFALAQRVQRCFPEMPIPLRLAFGAWWLAQESALDEKLIHEGSFEPRELRFVERYLRAGMIVLDVGAHHGLYTLLASKRVGRKGRVIAFEPSPRERKRLMQHVRVNRCTNVTIAPFALGDFTGPAELFVVNKFEDWCNSLRPPAVNRSTSKIPVDVKRADEALQPLGITKVDFVKLDVEGAELSFLNGAVGILRDSRPVVLVEVQDSRTKAWGYASREIIECMERRNYRWFGVGDDGRLEAVSTNRGRYDANLVALPEERAGECIAMLSK